MFPNILKDNINQMTSFFKEKKIANSICNKSLAITIFGAY